MNHISRRLLLHEGQMLYDNIRSEFLQLSGRNLLDGVFRRKIDLEEIYLALALQHRKMTKEDATPRSNESS